MSIRQAILAAADSIEQYPDMFRFGSVNLPNHECGTPGCDLGWIAHHLGLESPWYFDEEEKRFFNLMEIEAKDWDAKEEVFYSRMNALSDNWRNNADDSAIALRLYADKYHPIALPKVVTDIFKVKEAA